MDLADAQAGTFVVDSRFFLPALASQRDVLDQAIEEHGKQRKAVLRSVQRLKDFLELWKNEIQVRDGDLGAMEEARG